MWKGAHLNRTKNDMKEVCRTISGSSPKSTHSCTEVVSAGFAASCRFMVCITLPVLLAAARPAEAVAAERPRCRPTETNIEGPYYLPDAPFRERVAPPGAGGDRLVLTGTVRAADCTTRLAGAVVELWQTDAAGEYDFSEKFLFRGRVRTDGRGKYRFETIVPGRYRAGSTFRPAHIHIRVSHPGVKTLVSQIYFEDDPYNRSDPFVRRSLTIALTPQEGAAGPVWLGTFDLVLEEP